MAEIGIIASVIGVAGAGFRLSLILNGVGCEVASAGMEIHSISKGVTLFSLMLKQVGQTLQASDSVHSSEALETAQEITSECQMVFDEIQEMLDKVTCRRGNGNISPTIQQKFKWCFKKGRVQYLLAQLESLKMSLLVMLQILQLGKLMAVTPRSDHRGELAMKNDMIAQERAETQNVVIVRYWQINRLDRLYAAAEQEEAEEREKEIEYKSDATPNDTLPALEAPPDYATSTALIKLPIVSLGELDTTLGQIRESPRDMLRVSESVIDPLLDRWTRWQEFRGKHEARPAGRYTPSVHDLNESDQEKAGHYGDLCDGEESARGYYLEGKTTNWREPHSAAAKHEAARLKKKYARYQPSISVESSDEEGSQGHRRSSRGAPSRYVIDSSSNTSDSEPELPPQARKRNAESSYEKRSRHPTERPSPSQSYTNGGDTRATFGGRGSSSPNGTPVSTPRSSISAPRSPGVYRPMTNPVQNQYHHAYSSPFPPVHTSNAPNPYAAPLSPYSPNPNMSLQPPPYQGYGSAQNHPPRYIPPQGHRMPMPPYQRTLPHDAKPPRSPSRLSGHSARSHRSIEDIKKAERSRKHKSLTKSATKGVLGAGALAGFLEALEGLEL